MSTWLSYQDVSSASNVTTNLQLGYNNVSRNGNNVSFTFDIHVNYPGSWSSNGAGAWYNGDYRKCNANNSTGNKDYYASSGSTSQGSNFFTYSGTVGTNDTSVAISIGFANKLSNPTAPLTTVTYYVPIPESCRVSISQNTKTHNSITLNYSYSGASPSQVDVYNGSTFLGSYYSSPFTISNLSSKTTYNNIYAYGYNGSSGWGPASNSLSITTYPAPVTISSVGVSNIQPFSCDLTMSVSSTTDTNATEYSIYASNGTTLILGPYVDSSGALFKSISGINAETSYVAKYRVQTKDSLVWSSYSTASFTTISDQSQGWIKYSSAWHKGKAFIKNSGAWSPSKKTSAKVSGVWRDTTNN